MKQRIHIAVIDSGVNADQLVYGSSDNLVMCYSCEKNNYKDEQGHGTLIVNTILSHCQDIRLYIFKIFTKQLRCNLSELISVLKLIWKEYPFIHLINLSLGVMQESQELKDVCFAMTQQGIRIISAYNNQGRNSYPAAYPFILGVRSIQYINCYQLAMNSNQDIYIYGYLPYCLMTKSRIFIMGNSFACAHATGVYANQLVHMRNASSITLNEMNQYAHNVKDLSWIGKTILIMEEEERESYAGIVNDPTIDAVTVLGEEDKMKDYDTLFIKTYEGRNQKQWIPLIKKSLENGKNVFCNYGFHDEVNRSLYEVANQHGSIMVIKYII